MTSSRLFMLDRPGVMDERSPSCKSGGMDELDPWAPADPLGRALHLLRMNGAFYCRSELTGPWGLSLPPLPGYLWFHVLIAGTARLETPDGAPAQLASGELALVP